jgi:uncharacterized protein
MASVHRIDSFRRNYGPWAFVAGGTEGLGLEFSLLAAEYGLHVAVAGRRKDKLESAEKAVRSRAPVDVLPIQCDVASPGAVEEIDTALRDRSVGLFIYNACSSYVGPFLSFSPEEHREVIDTNCRGPLFLTHYFGGKMTEARKGGIILMSSMSGLQGTPMVASYAASKAYNLVLAQSLWKEFSVYGVDVISCVAGATLTPNYLATKLPGRRSSAPEMRPRPVAEETFRRLGKTPYFIPGGKNKAAVFFLRRLLGKKGAVNLVASNMFRQYGPIVPED